MTSVTLDLTPFEDQVLGELASKVGLTPAALLRQALRLYQIHEVKREKGLRMAFLDDQGREEPQLPMLAPLATHAD